MSALVHTKPQEDGDCPVLRALGRRQLAGRQVTVIGSQFWAGEGEDVLEANRTQLLLLQALQAGAVRWRPYLGNDGARRLFGSVPDVEWGEAFARVHTWLGTNEVVSWRGDHHGYRQPGQRGPEPAGCPFRLVTDAAVLAELREADEVFRRSRADNYEAPGIVRRGWVVPMSLQVYELRT